MSKILLNNSSEFAKKYNAQIENINKWAENSFNKDDKQIERFLSGTDIGGIGQGFFYNATKDYIKKNWEQLKLGELLIGIKNADPEKTLTVCSELQTKLKDICKKQKQERIPWAAIHAMVTALRPDMFCSIVSENNIDKLYKLLEDYKSYIGDENTLSEANSDSEQTSQTNENVYTIELKFTDWSLLKNAWQDAKKKENRESSWYIKSKAIHQYFKIVTGENEYWKKLNYPWETLIALKGSERVKILAKKLESQGNMILTGAPGTGKTYLAKEIAKQIKGNGDIEFVQFHPSYDYTDFVEGLRPLESVNNKTGETTISFKREDGIFKEFCVKAANDKEKNNKYIFIIDEINRGEFSKIFGELFFSIDPGYRGEDGKVRTQYANMVKKPNTFDNILKSQKLGHFFVPKNVYIIGTMNDIDRSVESMDFAFRRRFAFVEVTASDSENILYTSKEIQPSDTAKLVDMMQSLNKAILDCGLSEQYQIGGAYFLKFKDVKNKYSALWDEYLKGTLYEYFRGEPDAEEKMKKLKDAYLKPCVDNNGPSGSDAEGNPESQDVETTQNSSNG